MGENKHRLGKVGSLILTTAILLTIGGIASALPDVPVIGANEPHAAVVNPLNPHNVVVTAFNQTTRSSQLYISNDFGATFPILVNVANVPAGYGNCGDDVVAFDSAGRLWWSYLMCNNADTTIVVQQVNSSTGALVGAAIDVTPGNHSDDKQWIAADANPGSPFANNLYVVWTRDPAIPCTGSCAVMFSRSLNQGATWSNPAVISGGEGFVWPSHVAVAPNGDVYAAYHSDTCGSPNANMFVLRDSTGGADLAAGTPVQKKSFLAAVTCNVQGKTGSIPQTDFWMQGALAPYILPDPIRPGNIYVIANDDPNDNFTTGDAGDVVLARSTDYGNTWSVSTISHAPAGTLQVFPIGAVDQLGNIMVFWYDTRRGLTNTAGNFLLDVFTTVSRDGGLTFTNDFRINDNSFDPDAGAPCRFGCGGAGDPPPATLRIGEYNGAATMDGVGYAAWAGNNVPPPSATSQQVLFDVFSILGAFPDRFEPNDARQPGVPTDLGSAPFYSQDGLTIHSLTDEDFYKVVAHDTGKMTFQVQFNGRISDLDVQIQDQNGNPIANELTSGLDNRDIEKLIIPVVKGQTYYMRIFAELGQNSPFNTYGFTITNTPVRVPFEINLDPASDSGRSNSDDVTNINIPTINFRLDDKEFLAEGIQFSKDYTTPGYKVLVYDNGVLEGFANSNGNGMYQFTFPSTTPMTEGQNSITAKVLIVDPAQANGQGGESNSLGVTLDTIAPAPPSTPDLVDSSDNAGIKDDDITTIQTPKFAGTGEVNALVRIFANRAMVGQSLLNTNGEFETTVIPLADGVYDINAKLEDLAGNVGNPSNSLKVTIAHDSLNLPGTTSGLANTQVVVDLDAGAISGFPGIAGATGKIGIVGIPTINFDVNQNKLNILGTPADDDLRYKPTDAQKGTLTVSRTGQVLNFASVGSLLIDPLGGNDKVTTLGTLSPDNVKAIVNTDTKININNLLPVTMPIANVESLTIPTDNGVDTIDITAYSTVNANLLVDAGQPTNNPPNGDKLIIRDGSGGAKFQNQPGGPVPNSGSVVVLYPNKATRIDYISIEKLTIVH